MFSRGGAARVLAVVCVAIAAAFLTGRASAAPPANDQFAAAAELVGRGVIAGATNVEATKETGEPAHAGNAGGASIWYRWDAPAAGRVIVSTCASDFNTLLGVYTGNAVASLTEVAANDDSCGQQSRLSFQATAGTTYRIAVDGFGGATGFVVLSLDLTPPNDDFTASQQLSGDTGSVNGTNVGATSEAGEPPFGARSVWYHWTAPSHGWATFETCGNAFDTMLAAYTGGAVDQLTLVSSNDDFCNLGSRISFEASAGTVYRFAVTGYGGDMGEFPLSWNRNPPPPTPIGYPSITGIARDGETLTTTDGMWSGAGPFTFSYAWVRCDRDFECAPIPGANARTFTIRSIDVGFRLFARVTASSPAGLGVVESDLTGVVVGRPPANTSSPYIDGEVRLGSILVASPGDWSGTTPISFSYQWQTCNATESSCSDIPGQSGQVMRVSSAEVSDTVRVVVTATNVAGAASEASLGVEIERAVHTRCLVPRLRGKMLRAARAAIVRNHCRVGRVQRRFSSRMRAGRVLSQRPKAGARLTAGTRVHLVVSKGARR